MDDAHALALQSAFEQGQRFGILMDEQGVDSLCHVRSLRLVASSVPSAITPGLSGNALHRYAEPFIPVPE
jgi:hypothetical protein